MAIRGISTVLGNLSRQMNKTTMQGRKALVVATLFVKRESMNLTPVDTGNLRASHETEVVPYGLGGFKGEVRVAADYAIYVHEMPEYFHFRRPGSGPKFLERALFNNQRQVFEILAKGMQI